MESRLGMKQGQVAVPKQVDRADSAEFEFSDGDALHLAYLSFIPEIVCNLCAATRGRRHHKNVMLWNPHGTHVLKEGSRARCVISEYKHGQTGLQSRSKIKQKIRSRNNLSYQTVG